MSRNFDVGPDTHYLSLCFTNKCYQYSLQYKKGIIQCSLFSHKSYRHVKGTDFPPDIIYFSLFNYLGPSSTSCVCNEMKNVHFKGHNTQHSGHAGQNF